jgi:hypothetical protein
LEPPTKANTTFFNVAMVWLKHVGIDCADVMDTGRKEKLYKNVSIGYTVM